MAETEPSTHLDRHATTLVQCSATDGVDFAATTRLPHDARVDLHLLRHRAERAIQDRGTAAARKHITGLSSPDLLAGTIQDGAARGLAARLEEAISLCQPAEAPTDAPPSMDPGALNPEAFTGKLFEGKELRRKREILIASKGARIRFSRRGGILLVDRNRAIHEEDCIQFEDQRDLGCLDRFRPEPGVRPRLFSPAFLTPRTLVQGPVEDRLELTGNLGRGAGGYPCRITLVGRKNETGIRMTVWVRNDHEDHRLRIRFRGLSDPNYISHAGTPAFETIRVRDRTFLAATILRACGRLRVGTGYVATPDAQLHKPIEHHFGLGVEI